MFRRILSGLVRIYQLMNLSVFWRRWSRNSVRQEDLPPEKKAESLLGERYPVTLQDGWTRDPDWRSR